MATDATAIQKHRYDWYQKLCDDIQDLEFTGIVITKHAIGKRILQDELKFGKPEYGSKKIESLAKDVNCGKTEIYNCIQFARKYPEIPTASENWSWRHITHNILPEPREKPETPELPRGKFNVVYADPPWCYGDKLIEGYGAAEHHYPAMSIEQLCCLPVINVTDVNAVLFLWVTSPLLGECWSVIKSWGFEYKTSFVWDKVKHNYGHYNSVRHEFLLVCTKGSYVPQSKKLVDSVQTIERSNRHSEKPDEFRRIIEIMYPGANRLELFGRKKVEGWMVWGNEVNNEL